MGIFRCSICDNFADSDDGCEEMPSGLNLCCQDCLEEGRYDDYLNEMVATGKVTIQHIQDCLVFRNNKGYKFYEREK